EDQISAEQLKLKTAQDREVVEQKIARYAQQGAGALANAADKLNGAADNLGRVFDRIGHFPFGAGATSAVNSSLTYNITDLSLYAIQHNLDGFVIEGRSYILKSSRSYQAYLRMPKPIACVNVTFPRAKREV